MKFWIKAAVRKNQGKRVQPSLVFPTVVFTMDPPTKSDKSECDERCEGMKNGEVNCFET
jgi:hypothetical protein